jgi:hypothetical protein
LVIVRKSSTQSFLDLEHRLEDANGLVWTFTLIFFISTIFLTFACGVVQNGGLRDVGVNGRTAESVVLAASR